jgi:hypothetical protein
MAANANLRCWACGDSLAAVPLPFGRRAECPNCEVFIHCCRQCDFYDAGVSKSCRETSAEEVFDKEQANFCDFFRPRAGLAASGDPQAAAARAKLADVFGESLHGGKPAPGGASAPAAKAAPKTDGEAEAARRKLESLFGKTKT